MTEVSFMKNGKKFLKIGLCLCLVTAALLPSCSPKNGPETPTGAPDSLNTTDMGSQSPQENEPPYEFIKYGGTQMTDYSEYLPDKTIPEILKQNQAVAIAAEALKAFNGSDFVGLEKSAAERDYRTLTINPDVLSDITGKTVSSEGTTPSAAAKQLGLQYIEYDSRLVIFYSGDKPLFNTVEDVYSLEYLYLMLTGASEEELKNAFVTLPSLTSNNSSNSTYYTAPDLDLGLQTTIYDELTGGSQNVSSGPAIVAGEGKNSANHTLVRVFNSQQACISQFLAFDPSVTGGVQVCALSIDGGTYIATAAYDNSTGLAGGVKIYSPDGSLFMELKSSTLKTPFLIATGKFFSASEDILLMCSSSPVNGKIYMEFYSLTACEQLKKLEIDASFAQEGEETEISIRRNSGSPDSIILYFTKTNAAYEGTAETEFTKISVSLPENTAGVYASSDKNRMYTVTLKETDSTENLSLVSYLDQNGAWQTVDVGQRENYFYTTYNDEDEDGYVRYASFQHIRTDFSTDVITSFNDSTDSQTIYEKVNSALYSDWSSNAYVNEFTNSKSRVYLEPCFSHRLNAVPFNNAIMNYQDALTGENIYSSIGKSGEYVPYLELDSSFHVGTYADGILEMQKWRIYPLRSFLQRVSAEFRGDNGNPEKLVGISPVHEHEINVAGSVGDYNLYMIEGFRNYLLGLYGTVENINARFGTSFANISEIDAPRDGALGDRGEWDKYDGDYFSQWALYNRYIVNKRIFEAYREAMLAGFPPESISAHQIPEGDAISGFLGQADTRLSPVDAVLSSGTAYGGTRYAFFMQDKNNFHALASGAGHRSIVLGEYCSMSTSYLNAYRQLKYLWQNGTRMIHFITFNDQQQAAEKKAVDKLASENNLPRPGYTGGSESILGISQNGKTYDIVQVGQGENREGLLKSVNTDGTWEGTVYLVPFHAHVDIQKLESFSTISDNCSTTGKIEGLMHGDQVEITLLAKSESGNGKIKIEVFNDGYIIEDACVEYTVGTELSEYRYVLSNQITPESIEIKVTFEGDIEAENLCATVQKESVARKYFDDDKKLYEKSVTHVGGVNFDILDADMRA